MAKRLRLTNRLIWKYLREHSTNEPRPDVPSELAAAAAGTIARQSKRTFLWDDKQPGLAVMITERGHLSFVYQYRHNGNPYRLTFKRCRTLEEARKRAAEAALKVHAGTDPMGHGAPNPRVLRVVVADFLRHRPKDYKSGAALWSTLENHGKALLSRPIESLTHILLDDRKAVA